jgi:toxin ParE1/3/4
VAYRLLPQAEEDIDSIVTYIVAKNSQAARNWLNNIHKACQDLGRMPRMGVARFNMRPNLRMFPVGNYLILYQEGTSKNSLFVCDSNS